MDDEALVHEFLRAADRLGVPVRIEPFETAAVGGGGLCTLRGEPLILLDAHAPLWDRVRALADALAALESEHVYLVPEARELVDAMKGTRGPDGPARPSPHEVGTARPQSTPRSVGASSPPGKPRPGPRD